MFLSLVEWKVVRDIDSSEKRVDDTTEKVPVLTTFYSSPLRRRMEEFGDLFHVGKIKESSFRQIR